MTWSWRDWARREATFRTMQSEAGLGMWCSASCSTRACVCVEAGIPPPIKTLVYLYSKVLFTSNYSLYCSKSIVFYGLLAQRIFNLIVNTKFCKYNKMFQNVSW